MGRISEIIPPLYYEGKNEILPFVGALEAETDSLERQIKALPDLIDVDRCPEKYLPYLAAMTNCPLMGNDPRLWRRQIRNWPWLLKIKGTAKSLEVFLNSIGADDYRVKTYFRDADGNYTEEKPEGAPFFDEESGVWKNIRTHYFDLEVTWDDAHFLNWREWHSDFVSQITYWLERAKPFHAELLRWISVLEQVVPHDLYHGIATLRGGLHKIGLPRPEYDETRIHTGIATFRGG
ncbi:MAG: phage tail protein, partial [Synergistaceae bacterium]|nr:phage tail protein [Synergistaceae bacterium]